MKHKPKKSEPCAILTRDHAGILDCCGESSPLDAVLFDGNRAIATDGRACVLLRVDREGPDGDRRNMTLPQLVYDCDQCGLCCRGSLIVEADPVDALREPRIAERAELMDGHGTIPIIDAGFSLACGDPCVFLGADNRCEIYATRPGECVAFRAGDSRCMDLRREHGLPPLVPRPATDSFADRLDAARAAMGVRT